MALNLLTHGEKAGKPRKGVIRLAAHRDHDNVIVELIDDGAGINIEKVKAKAIESETHHAGDC